MTRLRLILAFIRAIIDSVRPSMEHAYWIFDTRRHQYRLDVYDRMRTEWWKSGDRAP